jgi:hypothetical protein
MRFVELAPLFLRENNFSRKENGALRKEQPTNKKAPEMGAFCSRDTARLLSSGA